MGPNGPSGSTSWYTFAGLLEAEAEWLALVADTEDAGVVTVFGVDGMIDVVEVPLLGAGVGVDEVEGFGPIGVEGIEDEDGVGTPNGLGLDGPGAGGRGPLVDGPREAASGSREPLTLALAAALAGRIWGNDGNGEGADDKTADGVINIERVPLSNLPPKSGSALLLGP